MKAAQSPQERPYLLTNHELDIIGEALGHMPHARVEYLVNKLRAQFQSHLGVENKPTGPVEAPTPAAVADKPDAPAEKI